MFFPITGAEIPSDDWKTIRVTRYPTDSFETHVSFDADIIHTPTGFHLLVKTTDKPNEYEWDVSHPDHENGGSEEQKQEILSLWSNLAIVCLPVLRQQAHRYGIDDDIYTNPVLSDWLLEIFVIEYELAEEFSQREYLTVWNDATDEYSYHKTRIPFTLQGEVEGLYWNRETQDWVRI